MEHFCDKHPTIRLRCPACIGARGGRKRAETLTPRQMKRIAKMGGFHSHKKQKRRAQRQHTRFTLAD
jgi:hypothetical protein